MPRNHSFPLKLLIVPLLVAFIYGLTQYINSSSAQANSNTKLLKVGFLCSGPVADCGWNYAHNQGRLYLESQMPNQIKTSIAENVPENSDAERIMEKMIAQGTKLIFTTSHGFLEPAEKVASRHPDVIFMQLGRSSPLKNIGAYYPMYYEPLYIAGTIAGHMTKTNKIGVIAGHPVPVLLLAINALTLGARSVNPKAVVKVIWINSWSDPLAEAEATKGLLESGVDVLTSLQNTQNSSLQTADRLGAYSIGNYANVSNLATKGWLSGSYFYWGPFYLKIAKSVMDGTWKPCKETCGFQQGINKLSTLGKVVPPPIKMEALELERNIKSGKFAIFKGPLKDREGKVKLEAGRTANIEWLGKIDFFVPGVEGSLQPK